MINDTEMKMEITKEENKKTNNRGFMLPTTIEEGMKLSEWIAKSDLAPKDFKEKPQNVLIAIQMGLEVGLSPMQAIQNISVINGRPSIWGDAMLALCQSHPDFEWINENESTDEKGVCLIKRKGMEAQRREFSITDARKAGLINKPGPWQTSQPRMLKLRARSFAIRDTFADALRGLSSAEEMGDVVDTVILPNGTQRTKYDSHFPMPKQIVGKGTGETQHHLDKETISAENTVAVPEKIDTAQKITIDQAKRFFTIAKGEGEKNDDQIKTFIKGLGLEHTRDMLICQYDTACVWASTKISPRTDAENIALSRITKND